MSEARPRGRPAQLSREQIVTAAATFDNVDTLTMRELAGRLQVSHAALYRWVGNRDELFDLISEVVVGRAITDLPLKGPWRRRLGALAWRIHDEFLRVPGYASHLARPHEHNTHSVDQVRTACLTIFAAAGVTGEMANQSWRVFMTSLVGWLATEEQSAGDSLEPRFDLFLGVLLRGLPARED